MWNTVLYFFLFLIFNVKKKALYFNQFHDSSRLTPLLYMKHFFVLKKILKQAELNNFRNFRHYWKSFLNTWYLNNLCLISLHNHSNQNKPLVLSPLTLKRKKKSQTERWDCYNLQSWKDSCIQEHNSVATNSYIS